MNNIKNMKGFTLMELLIVLIILSIIISIGLLVLSITRKKFSDLSTNNLELIKIQNSDMKLNSFFFNSDTIFFNGESKIISNNNQEEFFLDDEKIVNELNENILFDSISAIKMKFYKNKLNQMIVKSLTFSKPFQSKLLNYSYIKEYDIATRLKYPLIDSLNKK